MGLMRRDTQGRVELTVTRSQETSGFSRVRRGISELAHSTLFEHSRLGFDFGNTNLLLVCHCQLTGEVDAMSSTLMPFLYQTRTLHRLLQSPATQAIRWISLDADGLNKAQTSRCVARRRIGLEPRSRIHQAHRGSESEEGDGADLVRSSGGRSDKPPSTTEAIPFQWDGDDGPPELTEATGDSITSTITPTEERIFRTIFDDIAQKRQGFISSLDPDARLKSKVNDSAARPFRDASLGALASRRQNFEGAGSLIDQALKSTDRDRVLSMFPPSLRNAAELALGLHQAPVGTARDAGRKAVDPKSIPRLVHLEKMRNKETERMEELINSQETDLSLWEFMEEEIFTMPFKLGISPRPMQTQEGRVKEKRMATKQEEDKLSMDLHGPLYSIFLLKGLKRLVTGFGPASPLALNVLPRIKELGLASYVLGVSTPLCNELISLYFFGYGDLDGVLGVLREMQYVGLFFDEETLQVAEDILRSLEGAGNGEYGEFAKGLMTMPGYDAKALAEMKRWFWDIRTSLEELEAEVV